MICYCFTYSRAHTQGRVWDEGWLERACTPSRAPYHSAATPPTCFSSRVAFSSPHSLPLGCHSTHLLLQGGLLSHCGLPVRQRGLELALGISQPLPGQCRGRGECACVRGSGRTHPYCVSCCSRAQGEGPPSTRLVPVQSPYPPPWTREGALRHTPAHHAL